MSDTIKLSDAPEHIQVKLRGMIDNGELVVGDCDIVVMPDSVDTGDKFSRWVDFVGSLNECNENTGSWYEDRYSTFVSISKYNKKPRRNKSDRKRNPRFKRNT